MLRDSNWLDRVVFVLSFSQSARWESLELRRHFPLSTSDSYHLTLHVMVPSEDLLTIPDSCNCSDSHFASHFGCRGLAGLYMEKVVQ